MKFEKEIIDLFLDKQIRAPVHLSDGNEEQLIEIFEDVDENDWVFSTWRSHYHALLHGIDPVWLKREILAGRSISVTSKYPKFFSSAIVGGILPIAVGVSVTIKRDGDKEHVWVFVGDMTAETGIYHETYQYAKRHELPMTFVIEDNGLSTNTPTQKVWGGGNDIDTVDYSYDTRYPHVGIGQWVEF